MFEIKRIEKIKKKIQIVVEFFFELSFVLWVKIKMHACEFLNSDVIDVCHVMMEVLTRVLNFTFSWTRFRNSRGVKIKKIKSSSNSQYYPEACNERRGPSPQLSTWQVGNIAPKKHHSGDEPLVILTNLTGPGIETKTSRA